MYICIYYVDSQARVLVYVRMHACVYVCAGVCACIYVLCMYFLVSYTIVRVEACMYC